MVISLAAKARSREPRRIGDRLLAFFGVRLVIWLLAAQAFLPGVLTDPPHNVAGYHDEHNVVMHEEAARKSYVEYRQLPAWEPYFCGGIIGLSNAPSNVVAPDFLLRIVYGTLVGRRLAVLLFVVIGMEGVFRYARKNGASALGGAAAGVAFATSGYFVSLLGWGWIFMFHYDLVPWIALAFEVGIRKRWWIVVGGFFMAWLVLGGGTYVAPYTALMLFLLWINETVRAVFKLDGEQSVKWYRPTLVLVGMAVVTVGISALRLFPLLDLLSGHSRPVMQKDQTGPISVVSMLAIPRSHVGWGAGAGDFYVGSFIFLLAILALVFDRRAGKFWAVAIVFAAFACGEFIEKSPYEYMRKVPVFSQLRFPIRMLTISAMFVALAASLGITKIEDGSRGFLEWLYRPLRAGAALVLRAGRWVSGREWSGSESPRLPEAIPLEWKVVAAIATTFLAFEIAIKSASDVIEHNKVGRGLYSMTGPQLYQDEFRQSRGNRWDGHVFPFANRGSLHCFEEHELFMSPYLRGDLPNDEYPAPGTDTEVKRISWSPHRIVLQVKAGPNAGRFLVNQNHANAWRSDVGSLGSDGGLISVKVPPGEHTVTLTYRDWKLSLGAIVTAATCLAIARALAKRARRRIAAIRRLWRILPARTADVPASPTEG